MKNTGTPMKKSTRNAMVRRIKDRVASGGMKPNIGEYYMTQLLTKSNPGVTKVMVYGFHPTK